MERIIKIFLTFILLYSAPIMRADEEDCNLSLTEETDSDENDDRKNNDYGPGHRSAPMMTPCTISYQNGVQIFSIDETVNIVLYEIWDADYETCLGVYNDEQAFLDALYADKGEYIVVFTTTNKKYKGAIWLR